MKSKLNNYIPILNFGLSKGCLTISFNNINFHNTIFKISKMLCFQKFTIYLKFMNPLQHENVVQCIWSLKQSCTIYNTRNQSLKCQNLWV
jgi:hypothetical protein